MEIFLNEHENVSSITINGFEIHVCPSHVYTMSDGRRIVRLSGNQTARQKEPFDLHGLKVASTCGGAVIDKHGITLREP